ncbi:unnamed protein product [Caenorhabditis sp. 36 PRJEB53466]|nr:unnamed protein product [Caenorhabditis sp. 36 PRJEB53466]
MLATNAVNEERFKNFREQLAEFTGSLAAARTATEKAWKQDELQQMEGERTFLERVAEEKAKFAHQRENGEAELQKLTDLDEKLAAEKREWTEKAEESHQELMSELESEETIGMENAFEHLFGALIDSMDNLSHQSMNDQFIALKNNLDALSIEKQQLKVAIADSTECIESMLPSLAPTCGVTYKERNWLRIGLLTQVTKVRGQYQKSRLHEESLKAKLGV